MGVITISRQKGSLGDEIASLAAEKLGYRVVGAREYHHLALKCDEKFQGACKAFETEMTLGFLERLFFKEPANASLFASLNYELASSGKVILLGRGAQIVLSSEPSVLHTRILAPKDLRRQRIAQKKGISMEDAAEYLSHYDKRRRALVESVFDRDLSDFSLYDLILNTANLSAESCALLICQAKDELGESTSQQAFKDRMAGMALAKRVESELKRQIPTLPHRDITVEWAGCENLILNGIVRGRRNKELALKLAQEQPGVGSVTDELKTIDLSF
jgi:cytidylate kinase